MTLPTANNTQPSDKDNKLSTPNSSPRSSPRPSPRPQKRNDYSHSDTHLTTLTYRDRSGSAQKHNDLSPGDINGRGSDSLLLDLNRSASDSGNNKELRKERPDKAKKKSSWYNVLYPTYKSRSEDFKRTFKDVKDDERLVVDYSCALQKEILVHGRLYVTQNYLCFYANIFGWETLLSLKWKDVTSITKEKTALVIPNAVLVCTKTEKHFITSFAARDKTYLMLFRVWQNALMNQPMSSQELWQWVHHCYGDELGLTSDDEDYVPPGSEDKLSAQLSIESFSEHEWASTGEAPMEHMLIEDKEEEERQTLQSIPINTITSSARSKILKVDTLLPTDLSDTTESDVDKDIGKLPGVVPVVQCTSPHEGRELMNTVVPIHIDQLFTLLFTSSKFYLDFHAGRKTTDLSQSPWTQTANVKSRVVNLTVALNQSVGPKTAQVTETQIMLPCSKPGALYAIDVDTVNAGVPYADSFSVAMHYCLSYVSEHQSRICAYAQIIYKKSVWGLVKGMIEKNCWQGLEDFYHCLAKALENEADSIVTPAGVKRKSRRRRRLPLSQKDVLHPDLIRSASVPLQGTPGSVLSSDFSTLLVIIVLISLVFLNIMLYYKLWSLEESPPYTVLDLHVLKETPKSHEEWVKLLQQQETLHTIEIQKWQRGLKTALSLLKQTEEALAKLSSSIHPTYTEKVISVLQNHRETINSVKLEDDVNTPKVPHENSIFSSPYKTIPKDSIVADEAPAAPTTAR